jgi:hypothetical protein
MTILANSVDVDYMISDRQSLTRGGQQSYWHNNILLTSHHGSESSKRDKADIELLKTSSQSSETCGEPFINCERLAVGTIGLEMFITFYPSIQVSRCQLFLRSRRHVMLAHCRPLNSQEIDLENLVKCHRCGVPTIFERCPETTILSVHYVIMHCLREPNGVPLFESLHVLGSASPVSAMQRRRENRPRNRSPHQMLPVLEDVLSSY